MADPITAAVVTVGTVISGSQANKASKRAASAQQSAEDSAARQLAWEQEVYDREQDSWENTYGGIEQNLSNYYNSLSSDSYTTAGLEAFQLEQEQSLTAAREALAQRGLATSGAAAYTEIAAASRQGVQRASIRASADEAVANQQSKFLALGMSNQPSSAGVSNAMANQTGYAYQSANSAANSATQAQQQFGNTLNTVGYLAATNLNTNSLTGNSSTASQNYAATGNASDGTYWNPNGGYNG